MNGMALQLHTIPRAALSKGNGIVRFERDGETYVVADVDGDVQAYRVLGPSAASADRAAVVDGRLRCPLHGWPIDPIDGRCAGAERCRYAPLLVEANDDEIRVTLADA